MKIQLTEMTEGQVRLSPQDMADALAQGTPEQQAAFFNRLHTKLRMRGIDEFGQGRTHAPSCLLHRHAHLARVASNLADSGKEFFSMMIVELDDMAEAESKKELSDEA